MKYFYVPLMLLISSLFSLSLLANTLSIDSFKVLSGKIDIAGGTAHIPVMKDAAKIIMQINPNIRITIAGGGTGVGIQQVGEGLVDIGNTGRLITPAEQDKYQLIPIAFAIDGVTVAIHPNNPVINLSAKQVADIFSGTITNWKIVGGVNAPINIYHREDGSGTRETFADKLLDKSQQQASSHVVNSNGAMKTAIARDKNAIGYVGIGHIDPSVKAPLLDGIEPSQPNAKKGLYPVVRILYMNTKGEPEGLTKAFINYITSAEAQDIIVNNGYISITSE